MESAATALQSSDREQRLSSVLETEKQRLLKFIRRRVPEDIEAEDVLQDVFYELLEAYRLMKPIAHAGAWMLQVARNRITDLFRNRQREFSWNDTDRALEDLIPSPDAGPDALYARSVMIAELEAALEELPPAQREVFLAHEAEGKSFAEISAETGVSVNTLLSRKHYAVKRLRSRLKDIYDQAQKEKS